KEKIQGGYFSFSISPHKNVLHIYIDRNDETLRLIFSSNPRETALFIDRYRPPKKRNVIDFFATLGGSRIADISLADNDRLMWICFDGGKKLLFKLFSGRPNAFLVEDDVIVDAFKNPGELNGTIPPQPEAPDFKEEISPRRSAKNQMTEVNPLLPRNLLPYLIDQHDVEAMSPRQVRTFTNKVTLALKEDPHPRVLKTGDFCLWSKEWLDRPYEKACSKVNDCVAFAYKNAVHLRRMHDKKEDIMQFLERMEKQKSSRIAQLQQADRSLARAEKYEKFGHLLMAHAHESLPAGSEEMEVKDFYEGDRPVTIPLSEGHDIARNAEYYYEKAKDTRTSYKKARERLPKEQHNLEQVQQLRKEAARIDRLPDINAWLKSHRDTLTQLGYGSSDDKQVSSSYRKFEVGKYEVWIGKSAKSNDQLTSLAHKEDIWLHARGVGGSHVVIRMGNQKDYPPKQVILQSAGYAAYYSKAK